MNTPRTTATRTPVQLAALVTGVVFLLVGLLGFVPGVTTDYDQLQFASHDSSAMLLGVFQVSVLHNIVHLLFGVAAAPSRRPLAPPVRGRSPAAAAHGAFPGVEHAFQGRERVSMAGTRAPPARAPSRPPPRRRRPRPR